MAGDRLLNRAFATQHLPSFFIWSCEVLHISQRQPRAYTPLVLNHLPEDSFQVSCLLNSSLGDKQVLDNPSRLRSRKLFQMTVLGPQAKTCLQDVNIPAYTLTSLELPFPSHHSCSACIRKAPSSCPAFTRALTVQSRCILNPLSIAPITERVRNATILRTFLRKSTNAAVPTCFLLSIGRVVVAHRALLEVKWHTKQHLHVLSADDRSYAPIISFTFPLSSFLTCTTCPNECENRLTNIFKELAKLRLIEISTDAICSHGMTFHENLSSESRFPTEMGSRQPAVHVIH
ncbi:uncharacterized protein LY89DRAFT_209780 [Mollisia scopiformis]|uniref:Uncharacterized protein n=1 Tax=Mollisia scopiformis TaxID=149040 RepID=A0A194WX31_MOLSC|nr:uncharacterized protein LY89DRAFT_209780 [Mollisia scopiformis]KUJ12541.1 hypothetical protein LY89DRAFT_209780 [Mollisia scopiformis]